MSGSSQWDEVDVIRDVDGVVAVITRHRDRRHKWAIATFVEFQRSDGKGGVIDDRTIWIDAHLSGVVQKVLGLAKERVEVLKRDGLPAKAGVPAVGRPAANKDPSVHGAYLAGRSKR